MWNEKSNVKSLPNFFGCSDMYELYDKLNGNEVAEHHFPVNSDAQLFSIERDQMQERSKIVRQILHDDYMKKYGHGTH